MALKYACCIYCRKELLVGEDQNNPDTMYASHVCLEMMEVLCLAMEQVSGKFGIPREKTKSELQGRKLYLQKQAEALVKKYG